MKTLQTNDVYIKKFVDELNLKKSKLATLSKKEGGNLMTRDYVDDIYNSAMLTQADFIEGKVKLGQASEIFTNMLVVVPK